MPTKKELADAMVNADSAGDSDSAKLLAGMIEDGNYDPDAPAPAPVKAGDFERLPTGALSPAGFAAMEKSVAGVKAEADKRRVLSETLGDNPITGPLKLAGLAFGTAANNTITGLRQVDAEAYAALSNALGRDKFTNANAKVSGLRKQESANRQQQADTEALVPGFNGMVTASDALQTLPIGAAKKIGGVMALGGALGGVQPRTDGESRLTATAEGAGGAALLHGLTSAAGFAAHGMGDSIRNSTREFYDTLQKDGVQPHITALIDNGVKKSLMGFFANLPGAGAGSAIENHLKEFTAGMAKKFGLGESDLTQTVMKYADDMLTNVRHNLVGQHDIQYTTPDYQKIHSVLTRFDNTLNPEGVKLVEKNIKMIDDRMTKGNQQIDGVAYTALRGDLQRAAQSVQDTNPGAYEAISALRRHLDEIAVDSISVINPKVGQQLKEVNRKTSDFMVTDDALRITEGHPGRVSPDAAARVAKTESLSGGGPNSTNRMRESVIAANKLGVGKPIYGDRTRIDQGSFERMLLKIAAATGGAPIGRLINSRGGGKFLAEGVENKGLRALYRALSETNNRYTPALTKVMLDRNKDMPPARKP